MLDNTIKYYKRITVEALNNLKEEKGFQFRKYMTNKSLQQANESFFLSVNKSDRARELIDRYNKDLQNMYKIARKEYNIVLNKIKATDDPVLKQKLLDDYADNGIIGFVAKDGARWNIETYSKMYTSYVNNELVRMSVLEESKRQKRDRVKISSHGTVCNKCKPWEGRTITLEEYEEAKEAGFGHPHCLHIVLFVVGRI